MLKTLFTFINLAVSFVSYALALLLRFDFKFSAFDEVALLTLPLFLLLFSRHVAYIYWNINSSNWRHTATPDILRIVRAHVFSSLLFTSLVLVFRIDNFPRSVIFIEFLLSVFLICAVRVALRMLREQVKSSKKDVVKISRDVLIVGAGDSGSLLLKNLLTFSLLPYRPVAVLDDNERLTGSFMHGVPVLGRIVKLEQVLKDNTGISVVFIAVPSLSKAKRDKIKRICDRSNVVLKMLQSFEDIAYHDVTLSDERISIEALLDRNSEFEHDEYLSSKLRNSCVLVTGGGGSIGSEIVRQVLSFNPRQIVVVDFSEYNLFLLNRELAQLNSDYPLLTYELVNIVDKQRLLAVFDKYKPNVIFHAAAYKHVPLIEENPYSAFVNNVIGTRNVLEAIQKLDSSNFVLISTDKAVEPSSLMGSSKRICEQLTLEFNLRNSNDKKSYSIVRFGNVINSNGSVIPMWKSQILKGESLTVTHPDMERFFMSIKEAVRLVLLSGMRGKSGNIYVLDMGKPVKIMDVAKKMLALYGRKDLDIIITGMRPGEKLTEELHTDAEILDSSGFDPKVMYVKDHNVMNIAMIRWVADLESRLVNIADAELAQLMFDVVQESVGEIERKLTA